MLVRRQVSSLKLNFLILNRKISARSPEWISLFNIPADHPGKWQHLQLSSADPAKPGRDYTGIFYFGQQKSAMDPLMSKLLF